MRSTIAVAVAVLLLASPLLAGEGEARLVAYDGQIVQDRPWGTVVVTGQPAIDEDGDVLFRGWFDDDGYSRIAWYLGRRAGVRSLVLSGADAPAAGGIDVAGFDILSVFGARLSPAGRPAFVGRFDRAGHQVDAVWSRAADGTFGTLAVEDLRLPGICSLGRIGAFSDLDAYGLHDDHLVFGGRYGSVFGGAAPCDPALDGLEGVFRRKGAADIESLAAQGSDFPGLPGQEMSGPARAARTLADGTAVILTRARSGGDDREVLLLLDPGDGGFSRVARLGDEAPGTGDTAASFGSATIAGRPGGAPRALYSARLASSGDWVLFDTSDPAAPIVRTGDGDGTNVLVAGRAGVAAELEFAPADGGRAIVVGASSGADIPAASAPGVWRYDPAAEPGLDLLAWPGMAFRDGEEELTVETLIAAFVNRDGRAALEVSYRDVGGRGTALLIEARDAPGRLVAAIRSGDVVETAGGTGRVVSLSSRDPTTPELYGSGVDGMPARMNGEGEVVVHLGGTGDGDVATGIYVVSLDEPEEEPECDVRAELRGGSLVVTGDEGDCDVLVRSLGLGEYEVLGGERTSVNGEDSFSAGPVDGSVIVSMGAGNDRVEIRGVRDEDVPGNLSVDLGGGSDDLDVAGLEVTGKASIRTGPGADETVEIADCGFSGALALYGAEGRATFALANVAVVSTLKVRNGQADGSRFSADTCDFGTVKIRGGDGSDEFSLRRVALEGSLKLDAGAGALETVTIDEMEQSGGTVTISGRKAGRLEILVTGGELGGTALKILTGRSGCDVVAVGAVIGAKTLIRTRGTDERETRNDISLDDVTLERLLVVKGKGDHDVTVTGGSTLREGANIKLKAGGVHVVEISETAVEEGSVAVLSKATGSFEGRFGTLTLAGPGQLGVKGGNGDDEVRVYDCAFAGSCRVSLGNGDDRVDVHGVEAGGDLRVSGGPGNDTLDWGSGGANTVGGNEVRDGFEILGPW